MKKLIENVGGRKMVIFLLVFLVTTILFVLKYDVKMYGETLMPFVGILVIGNVGEHMVSKKSE